jgi:hypothetical protein
VLRLIAAGTASAPDWRTAPKLDHRRAEAAAVRVTAKGSQHRTISAISQASHRRSRPCQAFDAFGRRSYIRARLGDIPRVGHYLREEL